MGWILPGVGGGANVKYPPHPWRLHPMPHGCCASEMCPVMSFPAASVQGIIVGSYPDLSAQFFLCSSSGDFYLSF